MKKYKCLVVDDERLAQQLLEKYIDQTLFLEWVASCSSSMEAMMVLQQEELDLMFLDIQMPHLTGIEFLRSLKQSPPTIFTTAYSDYAVESYELGILDYLMKPIEFERFFKAVSKILSINSAPISLVETFHTLPKPTYFFIKSDSRLVRIEFADLLFIEALQKYIRIHTKQKRMISLVSLSKIETQLPNDQFIRIHRSYIINISKIDSVEGNFIMINKHQLPISKGKRTNLFALLDDFKLGQLD